MIHYDGRTIAKGGYKSCFDRSILVLAHVLFAPLWVLLWMVIPFLIWLDDRGPVFYKQQRMGKDSVPFNVIKFRTMVADAENRGPAWTTVDDPRVTRVGRILRRTALDELPEVISIWQGKMSFVGPRALDVEEHRSLEELMPGFEMRLQVRPGLTGLAQIHDKSDDPYEKYRYDMEYLQRMHPLLDVQLLLLSVWNTLIARWDHRSGKARLIDVEVSRFEPSDSSESTGSETKNSH